MADDTVPKQIYHDWHNQHLTSAEAIAKLNAITTDDVGLNALVSYVIGIIYGEQKHVTDAIQYLVEAEKLFTQLNDHLYRGYTNRLIADYITQVDELSSEAFKPDADYYYNQALNAFEQISNDQEIANTLLAHGQSLTQRGDKRSASVKYQRAMAILTRLNTD